ncbi:MAG: aspartate--tRNA(Asn) ligase [Candidatus Shapirobacteria bacterium]|jgi:nondiscriminating aspartyl-tRNA synthetase
MHRTLISDTLAHIGQLVKINGWVDSVRSHGQLVFADIRDRSGLVQIVGDKNFAVLKNESVIEITGTVKQRDPAYVNSKIPTGTIEVSADSFKILSLARDLPFDIHTADSKVTLPILLDYRAASLRNKKIQDIFRVQATITQAFRDYLISQDFTEFHAPTIVAAASEGGSQVFPVDYFGYKAYLAQSPQLYKQIMVSIFERVFSVAHAYRAEPSVTTRHITEFVSLDVELGFIDSWMDVVKVADSTVKAIFQAVAQKHADILAEYGLTVPKTVENTPVIKLKEALTIIYQRTGRDVQNELDMDPEGEREICRWSLETHGSDMVFITHFPTKKRAWYSFADPENPEETLSFDLIGRGVEWISGSQRIHDYDELTQKIIKVGQKPEDYENPYTQAFKYGMPPEGGFAIGLERVTQNILALDNIRQATLYPRDMERIDGRLSQIGKKFQSTPSSSLFNRLIEFLTEKSVSYKLIDHPQTKTSQDSATARGTRLEQGAKALVAYADSSPVLIVLSAAKKLDNSLFKSQFGVKDLRLATPAEVETLSGVPVGAVPPFGNLFNLVTYVDKGLLSEADIAFNAGSLTKSLIIKSADFVNSLNPKQGEYVC